jgi:hypothetical protein
MSISSTLNLLPQDNKKNSVSQKLLLETSLVNQSLHKVFSILLTQLAGNSIPMSQDALLVTTLKFSSQLAIFNVVHPNVF